MERRDRPFHSLIRTLSELDKGSAEQRTSTFRARIVVRSINSRLELLFFFVGVQLAEWAGFKRYERYEVKKA